MGPDPASSIYSQHQGAGRRRWQPHKRLCLLKGCNRWFLPLHPLDRYCGSECRTKARRWQKWQARHRYRSSLRGRAVRRAQSKRWRDRLKDGRKNKKLKKMDFGSRVGHQISIGPGFFFCDRPGCYVITKRSARSPLQRFCSSCCRSALRRVVLREKRLLRKYRFKSRHWVDAVRIKEFVCDPYR